MPPVLQYINNTENSFFEMDSADCKSCPRFTQAFIREHAPDGAITNNYVVLLSCKQESNQRISAVPHAADPRAPQGALYTTLIFCKKDILQSPLLVACRFHWGTQGQLYHETPTKHLWVFF